MVVSSNSTNPNSTSSSTGANGQSALKANYHQQQSQSQSQSQPHAQNQAQVNPFQIGWLFVQQYYSFHTESPERLYLFYNTNSVWSRGVEGDQCQVVIGQKAIQQALKNQNLENSKVLISSVDCQASMAGGVIIQALGELISEQQCFKFSQTFFLAQQPEGYYVLNDIFRFLKEDVVEFQDDANGDEWETNRQDIEPSSITQNSFNYREKAVETQKPASASVNQPPKVTASPSALPTSASPPKQQAVTTSTMASAAAASKPQILTPASTTSSTKRKEELASTSTTDPSGVTRQPPNPKAHTLEKKSTGPVTGTATATGALASSEVAPRASMPTKKSPQSWSNIVSSPGDGTLSPQTQTQTAPVNSSTVTTNATNSVASSRQTSAKPYNNPNHTIKKKEDAVVASDGFQPVTPRHKGGRNGGQVNMMQSDEKDKCTIYIRGVPEGADKRMIMEAFDHTQAVLHADLPVGKGIAFVTFKTAEIAQSCIGMTVNVKIGTRVVTLLAEERRKSGANSYENRGDRGNGGRGRGFEGVGGYRNNGGGFRGGRGNPRGANAK